MSKKILITAGPTREYLDPVRYLSNGSSGRMGAELARSALDAGFDVAIVSGPVRIDYPQGATVTRVVSTAEMLDAAAALFPDCVGVIGVAAPCDFTPCAYSAAKMTKDDLTRGADGRFSLELRETPDIMAALGAMKRSDQWSVAFALETDAHYERAQKKRIRKNADLIVLNRPSAIGGKTTAIEILAADGVVDSFEGDKPAAAKRIIDQILWSRAATGLSTLTREEP